MIKSKPQSKAQKKILLAIDPLEEGLKLSPQAARELKYWVHHLDATLEAVYVFSSPEDNIRVNRAAFPLARKSLENTVKDLHLNLPIASTVLSDPTTSRWHTIHTFLKYAKRQNADMIILTSHGRTGLSRLVFGSFAESLLADSPIPIFFLGVKPATNGVLNKVLFPTDFSEESEKAFGIFLTEIAPLKPEIVVFHSIAPKSFVYNYSLMGLGAYLPEDYWKTQKDLLIQTGETWLKKAHALKLKARFVIDDESLDTTDAIEKVTREEKITMLALYCKKVGKVLGHLFQTQKYGIWLYGEPAVKKLKVRVAKSRAIPRPRMVSAARKAHESHPQK